MHRVHISPAAAAKTLTAAIAILVVLSMAGQISTYYLGFGSVFGLVNAFSLDREANLPTWYQSVTLLACAFLLAVITVARRRENAAGWKYWAGMSALFLACSIDEAASFHELLIEPVGAVLGTGGILHWAWVVPGMIFVAVLGIIYLKFLLALPPATRRLFFVSAGLFLFGALGMEMLGAGWFSEFGRRNMGYVLFWTVEETFEMAGVAVFICALLGYIRDHVGPVLLVAGDAGDAAPG